MLIAMGLKFLVCLECEVLLLLVVLAPHRVLSECLYAPKGVTFYFMCLSSFLLTALVINVDCWQWT